MFLLHGGILPHQRSGGLGHLWFRLLFRPESALGADYNKAIGHPIVQALRRKAEMRVDAASPAVFSECMDLRKDPITRSWVMTGDDPAESSPRRESACRFCPDSPDATQVISATPSSIA